MHAMASAPAKAEAIVSGSAVRRTATSQPSRSTTSAGSSSAIGSGAGASNAGNATPAEAYLPGGSPTR